MQYTTEPSKQNPGGDETSTLSARSQKVCVTIRIPARLTFSVGTTANIPGLWRLVSHRGRLDGRAAPTVGSLRSCRITRRHWDRQFQKPRHFLRGANRMRGANRNYSSARQMEKWSAPRLRLLESRVQRFGSCVPHFPRNRPGSALSSYGRESKDAEREIESGQFLKLESGESPTVRQENVKSRSRIEIRK